MSVPKYERKFNDAEYVKKTFDALMITLENLNKLSRKHKIEAEKMETLCVDAYSYAQCADGIFMDRGNFRDTFKDKQKFTRFAAAKMNSAASFLDVLYELVKKGDDCFGDAKKRDKVFVEWGAKIEESRLLLFKMIEVNESRKYSWETGKAPAKTSTKKVAKKKDSDKDVRAKINGGK